MANYAISGVWKDSNNVITHYAIHTVNITENNFQKAIKYTKAQAIQLLDNSVNSARTLIWNYSTERWNWGTTIDVVGSAANKYLRTVQDSTERNNLAHLINYGWVANNFT
ncbi:DUF3892 domain-containing protein [Chryseobacterium carnipullorum]|uniref:DUF3892 domain-containing protein n=1 Tax=Chryseobacterium carnipullorum TaxID=1124835 RepID=UPI000E8B474B|nr:DUF3892 domain-containing protein [Chryseobacterium carnipullorum]HBV15795.1 hypothetical protein [Chryseobacterium carnipullorum]